MGDPSEPASAGLLRVVKEGDPFKGDPLAESESMNDEQNKGPASEPKEKAPTRGQKAAATRRRNQTGAKKAEAVDTALAVSKRPRNRKGRFTPMTLKQWQSLLDGIEGAKEYLVIEGAELVEATIVTTLAGNTFRATYAKGEWSVEVVT